MKAIKNMLYIAAMATAITACTSEDALAPELNTPLTVSATIPGDVWAVASRSAEGEDPSSGSSPASRAPQYSAWTLHYTDYQGHAATYAPTVTVTMNEEVEASFTTGDDLVWAKIDATQPIHLTCVTDNGTDDTSNDYTLHVSVASATPRQTLAFEAMKPTVAKLTVNFSNLTDFQSGYFTIICKAKVAAGSYDPMTATPSYAWPVEGDATDMEIPLTTTGNKAVTGTMLLPQQEIALNVIYNNGTAADTADDITLTLDLSKVTVKDAQGADTDQQANQLKAGQHLTLNLKASVISLNGPMTLEFEAFADADADDYQGVLGGEVKTFDYDAATDTYTVYHPHGIAACLKDRAAHHSNAKVMYNGIELKIVNGMAVNLIDGSVGGKTEGTADDVAAVKAQIETAVAAGITEFTVINELAIYDQINMENPTCAAAVVGEAIRQLVPEAVPSSTETVDYNGSITLTLADATVVIDAAFLGCTALKSVSAPAATLIGRGAFIQCTGLEEVELDVATEIDPLAFYECTALQSVSAPAVTEIGNNAFNGCTDLQTVTLGHVTNIATSAFSGTQVTNLNFDYLTFLASDALSGLTFSNLEIAKEAASDAYINLLQKAFRGCTLTGSVKFHRVVGYGSDVVDGLTEKNAFEGVTTSHLDLYLAANQPVNQITVEDGQLMWAGTQWKSIKVGTTEYEVDGNQLKVKE